MTIHKTESLWKKVDQKITATKKPYSSLPKEALPCFYLSELRECSKNVSKLSPKMRYHNKHRWLTGRCWFLSYRRWKVWNRRPRKDSTVQTVGKVQMQQQENAKLDKEQLENLSDKNSNHGKLQERKQLHRHMPSQLLEWHIHLWIPRNYYMNGTLGRTLKDPQHREDQKQKGQWDATGTHVVSLLSYLICLSLFFFPLTSRLLFNKICTIVSGIWSHLNLSSDRDIY